MIYVNYYVADSMPRANIADLIGNYCRSRQRLPRQFEAVCVKYDSPGDYIESQHKVCQG